jgi:hypothetical protein
MPIQAALPINQYLILTPIRWMRTDMVRMWPLLLPVSRPVM